MRAAAEAIAVSWLKIDSASVSSTTHSAKLPLHRQHRGAGEVQLALGVAVDVAAEPEVRAGNASVSRVEELRQRLAAPRRRT